MKTRLQHHRQTLARLVIVFGVVAAMPGCGGDSVARSSLSGAVTYGGTPVKSGFIVFEPDATKGNRGPQGYASIANGRYETDATGKGSVTGPVKVRIVGLNSPTVNSEDPGAPIFSPYEQFVEITGAATLDFDVPKTHK